MKKTYINPSIEVIEFAAENIIAQSVGVGYGQRDAMEGFSNEYEPSHDSWNAEGWSSKGE